MIRVRFLNILYRVVLHNWVVRCFHATRPLPVRRIWRFTFIPTWTWESLHANSRAVESHSSWNSTYKTMNCCILVLNFHVHIVVKNILDPRDYTTIYRLPIRGIKSSNVPNAKKVSLTALHSKSITSGMPTWNYIFVSIVTNLLLQRETKKIMNADT